MAYGLNRYVALNRVQFSGSEGLHALLHTLYSKKTNFVILHHCYNWLPVAYQIVFKLALTYISELVSLKDSGGWGEGGSNYLRLNDGKLLNIPSCKSIFFHTW